MQNARWHLVQNQDGRRVGMQLEQFENFWVESRLVPNVRHVDQDDDWSPNNNANDYKQPTNANDYKQPTNANDYKQPTNANDYKQLTTDQSRNDKIYQNITAEKNRNPSSTAIRRVERFLIKGRIADL